ncbi:hypothetical protein ABD67_10455 [Bacillus sonorensis]|nr:hypothetical protein [Bacillus sonorensis]
MAIPRHNMRDFKSAPHALQQTGEAIVFVLVMLLTRIKTLKIIFVVIMFFVVVVVKLFVMIILIIFLMIIVFLTMIKIHFLALEPEVILVLFIIFVIAHIRFPPFSLIAFILCHFNERVCAFETDHENRRFTGICCL